MTASRAPGLEAVRGLAAVQGIFFHAGLSFASTDLGWVTREASHAAWSDAALFLSHGMRMPLFFWLAGHASARLLERATPLDFLVLRFKRLGQPLLWSAATLLPISLLAWVASGRAPKSHGPSLATVIPGHLWFLLYVLLFSVAAAGMWRHGTQRWLARLGAVDWRVGLPALAGLQGAALWLLRDHAGDPSRHLMPLPQQVLGYGLFFGVGLALGTGSPGLEAVRGCRRWATGSMMVTAVGWLWLAGPAPLERLLSRGNWTWAECLAAGAFSWSAVLAVLGAALHWVRRSVAPLAWLGRASLLVYLLHLPVVVWLQVALHQVTLWGPLKYGLLVGCSLALTLALSWVLLARREATRPKQTAGATRGLSRERDPQGGIA
jgi:glucan biosynthesis protein C